MQHLSTNAGDKSGSWQVNQDKVIKFLGEGEQAWLGNWSTQYAEKITLLYQRLPDSSDIDPASPLKSIPQSYMDDYLALLNNQTNMQFAYLQSNEKESIA
jgi:hypothetical protein